MFKELTVRIGPISSAQDLSNDLDVRSYGVHPRLLPACSRPCFVFLFLLNLDLNLDWLRRQHMCVANHEKLVFAECFVGMMRRYRSGMMVG